MTPVCPFVKAARPDDASPRKLSECPNKSQQQSEGGNVPEPAAIPPKCPFGYDSQTFKIGPLSCIICQSLLYESSRCVPCTHVYCKACISRFKDCPLCGADIKGIEADENLQSTVDKFIEGHARISRYDVNEVSGEGRENERKTVTYEDVSLERGSFLLQQASRAFRANNVESAKSRLSLCEKDIRIQLERMGNTSELCSQLGAVLGMLGDCCRALGDSRSALAYFEESVSFLSKFPANDLEIARTISVSLNKIGDLKYYDGDLQSARSFYSQSLSVRRDAIKDHPNASSQVLDVAVSLAKVSDLDRILGSERAAIDGFQEATTLLESLILSPDEASLEQRRGSVLGFLRSQLAENQAGAKNG